MISFITHMKMKRRLESRSNLGFRPPRAMTCCLVLMAFFTLALLAACDSGSGGSSSSTTADLATLATYEMPTEISAVPVDTDATDDSASLNSSLVSNLRLLSRAAADAGTDYSELHGGEQC